ncbi:MAG: bifunctional methylenetetrahydrofolate dehydrogenase/methenyltetrahydrofolate cyclohydrolase FolD [Devosiaceae bacterium]|nr:bifunctional methylenetetrahydrofolate dehydrogenase/methenyltetrahydrofolate cyclohydrolase FolD [Devosiaceae bacterium]
MTAGSKVIDGKVLAGQVRKKVRDFVPAFVEKTSIIPGLAVVLVGDDAASQVYVASKGKAARECGLNSFEHILPQNTSSSDLLALIATLNADKTVHGILVQMPLPAHLNEYEIIQAIDPKKDVDGLTLTNVGKLGSGHLEDAFVPCTPAGCMLMIEQIHGKDLSSLNAIVIGRSILVGKPVANLLLLANATVTIAHSRTANLPEICSTMDIIVAAVGRPQMIRADWIGRSTPRGPTIIDVGINRIDAPERGPGKTRLVGDVDFNDVEPFAGAITPVPGGVGPMTIAILMANTLRAACIATGEPTPRF